MTIVDLTSSPLLMNVPDVKENVDTAQLLNDLNSEFSFNGCWESELQDELADEANVELNKRDNVLSD